MAYQVANRTKQQDQTILTYELSERIHSTCVYPLPSSNGSSIVLYAHNAGISVLWRGGQPLKAHDLDGSANGPNGDTSVEDGAMVIDSEDDTAQTDRPTSSNKSLKRQEQEDQDEAASVIGHTTIEMEVTPLHLSVPPLGEYADVLNTHHALAYFENNIVVAAVCADGSVRLLSLPGSPTNKKHQQASQEVVVFSDENTYKTPGGVSLSFIFHGLGHQAPNPSDDFDLLVAWHVSEPVAALSVAAISLDKVKTTSRFGKPRRQTYHLTAPLTSLSFNPAVRHTSRQSQLLAADVQGVVRICTLKFVPKTSPSGSTQNELARWPNWTGTFYGPFDTSQTSSHTVATPCRKKILGAEWALDGRCAIVLLQDATWGLWDFEGARPELSGPKHLSRPETGVYGGGVTNFVLRGNLESKSRSSGETINRNEPERQISAADKRLAPMTPNTRKAKQNVFLDKAPSRRLETSRAAAGGISVSKPAQPVVSAPYETVVFWHNESVYAIPNLMLYWQRAAQTSSGNAAAASRATVNGPSPIHLTELSTLGEPITSIAQLPAYTDDSLSSQQRLEHDFIVAAEHRQIFLCPPRPQLSPKGGFQPPANRRAPTNQLGSKLAQVNNDEQLLARGQLGLAGLDRLMDDMDSNSGGTNIFGQPQRPRRVGFAQDP